MFNSKQIFLTFSAMLVSGVALAASNQASTAKPAATTPAKPIAAIAKGSTTAPIAIDKSSTANNTIVQQAGPVRVADAEITDKVKEELLASKDISSLSISVATDKGVVTLNGTVESEVQKEQVVKIASSIAGVKSIVDQLGIGN